MTAVISTDDFDPDLATRDACRRCAGKPRRSSRRPGEMPSRPRSASRRRPATPTRSGRSRFRCANGHSPPQREVDELRERLPRGPRGTVRRPRRDVAGRGRHMARPARCAFATVTSERARSTATDTARSTQRPAYFPGPVVSTRRSIGSTSLDAGDRLRRARARRVGHDDRRHRSATRRARPHRRGRS